MEKHDPWLDTIVVRKNVEIESLDESEKNDGLVEEGAKTNLLSGFGGKVITKLDVIQKSKNDGGNKSPEFLQIPAADDHSHGV